jgi:beta propeller repeat protein
MVILLLISISGIVNAAATEIPITTNEAWQISPDISGNRIVWMDNRSDNWDIYMYDLTTNTEKRITTDTANQDSPSISGNRIVWADDRNGNKDIYMYDLSTNTENQITTNTNEQSSPVISGNRIVYVDAAKYSPPVLYMYDLSTNTKRLVTTNIVTTPVVFDGTLILWADGRNGYGNYDIYMYDLSTNSEKQITSDPADQYYPAISGTRIVWEDMRNGYADIYMYDLSTNTETRITTYSTSEMFPDISGNRIVWDDHRNGNEGIYMYDLSTGIEKLITNSTGLPSIDGTRIVWTDYRNGNSDIYMNDISMSDAPDITGFAPISAIVGDNTGASRSFNISINQTVDVNWSINGTPVQLNASVTGARYTNSSSLPGTWIVNATATNANGTVSREWIWTVTLELTPIQVTNPDANPAMILNDNGRARPPGTNITRLNVTVTGNVASVIIDISPLGGLAKSPMTKISGTDIYSITTNATAGINLTNDLVVNVTDTNGNFNNSTGIPVTVLLRGDIVRDNKIDLKDLLYMRRYLAGLEPTINTFVADIQQAEGDSSVDLKDLLYLRRYLAGLEPLI